MELKKIDDFRWEIPMEGKMNVPGIIFSNEKFLEGLQKDKCLEQVKNVAMLPGILKASYGMADAHQGYGFPIGGVAAFDLEKGVISPGGVGYDINCSVRLLKTNLKRSDLKGIEKKVARSLFNKIPTGVGKGNLLKISPEDLDNILVNGAKWIVEKGYGSKEDLEYTEENGCLKYADPSKVSSRAKARGIGQLGSLGAGNHFIDLLEVTEVFDKKVARVFGLEKDSVVILVHCGSRGIGHQVASDYVQKIDKEYGHPKFDRELAYAPINSLLGKEYLSAMSCAANFAFANKQLITHELRKNLRDFFPEFKAEVVYDICHNIAKKETHEIENLKKEVLVVRKGATRSLGPKRKELPKKYNEIGSPILIPGTMGTASYVLCGTKKAEALSMASNAHGAGRAKSRTQIKKEVSFEDAKEKMEQEEIFVESGSKKGLVEESPDSYKDVEGVVDISHKSGIGIKVAKLQPFMVIIG